MVGDVDDVGGQLKGPGAYRNSRYAQQVAEEFPGTLQNVEDAQDAVDQYRKINLENPLMGLFIIVKNLF